MRDSQHGGQIDHGADGVALLARSVVARLMAREETPRPADPALLARAARAAMAPDPQAFDAIRSEFRRARISDADLVDVYLPQIARRLGSDWADDRASWTDVTIGVARMQGLLRGIGQAWSANAAPATGPTVLVLVPEGEQHSFGAMVLAGQLRRRGVSVQLQLGVEPAGLRGLVTDRDYDCAMVSVACEEKLALSAKLVKALRHATGGRLPISVGGPVLERRADVQALTGADIATSDPMAALTVAAGLRKVAQTAP